jgi:hypothetical protein
MYSIWVWTGMTEMHQGKHWIEGSSGLTVYGSHGKVTGRYVHCRLNKNKKLIRKLTKKYDASLWYGMWILYNIYTMVAGNHISLVWCVSTMCIIFYGCGKPYYILWWQETIPGLYGMEILYVLYFMAAGNHTSLVWCVDTI